MSVGAVNAHADDAEQCTKSENIIRCTYTDTYNYRTDDGRAVTVVSKQTLSCQSGPNTVDATAQEAEGDRETNVSSGSVCSQNGRTYTP